MTLYKTSVLASVVLACCVATAPAQTPPLTTALKMLEDQPLPASVLSGTLSNFQYTSELDAQIRLDRNLVPKDVEFYLVIFNGGRIVAGEGWTEHNPQAMIHRQTKVALSEGDQALLMVDSVTTDARTFSLQKKDTTEHVKKMINGEATVPLPVELSMIDLGKGRLRRVGFDTKDTFCSDAQASAVAACGNGQISSFSCNEVGRTYSYSCKGGTTQPPKTPPS